MKQGFIYILLITLICLVKPVYSQQLDLDYFINNALKNDVGIKQNTNQQQYYSLLQIMPSRHFLQITASQSVSLQTHLQMLLVMMPR